MRRVSSSFLNFTGARECFKNFLSWWKSSAYLYELVRGSEEEVGVLRTTSLSFRQLADYEAS